MNQDAWSVSWETRKAGRALDLIIGLALVDESFCQALLSNSNDLLAHFELAADEREALASIHADSLELFARQLWDRLESTGETEDRTARKMVGQGVMRRQV